MINNVGCYVDICSMSPSKKLQFWWVKLKPMIRDKTRLQNMTSPSHRWHYGIFYCLLYQMWFTPSFPPFLSLLLQQHFAQTATSSKGTEQSSNSLCLTARTLRWHHKQLRLIWASESHKESDINLSALILTQRGQKNTSYIYAAQVQAKKHHAWWTKKITWDWPQQCKDKQE